MIVDRNVRHYGPLLAVSAWISVASPAGAGDPFADVVTVPPAATNGAAEKVSWRDNLLVRRELYLLVGVGGDPADDARDSMGRYSAGIEIQKRFATPTRTFASADYQGRIVYRDSGPVVTADPMGRGASPWEYETHNAYADFYTVCGEPGRYNFRAGYFYQPFGLNTQTDTHGTLLQLSNERVFGSDRDWQGILHGSFFGPLDYQVGYLLGAGPNHEYRGQSGLGVARLALNNEWLFQQGLEGGLSVAAGERVDPHVVRISRGPEEPVVRTQRIGLDARRRLDTDSGPFTLTAEGAFGTDEGEPMVSAMTQLDWLNPGRRWGAACQYYYFRQEGGRTIGAMTEDSVMATLTRYFRNDVGNANLHWLALGVEHPLRNEDRTADPVLMIQYYYYW